MAVLYRGDLGQIILLRTRGRNCLGKMIGRTSSDDLTKAPSVTHARECRVHVTLVYALAPRVFRGSRTAIILQEL